MKRKNVLAFGLMALGLLGLSPAAQAFCMFSTDCPGGAASYEADPRCKTDFDCPYEQQCNTATGLCFKPESKTDSWTPPPAKPAEPGTDWNVPWPILNPVPLKPVPLDPTPPIPVTPDPEPLPTPPTPPSDPCEAYLGTVYYDCCVEAEGDPVRMLDICVEDGDRDEGCSNVIAIVAGKDAKVVLEDFNQCCQAVNNKGSIAGSTIEQACENVSLPAPSREETDGDVAASAAPKAETAAPGGADGTGGCSLIR